MKILLVVVGLLALFALSYWYLDWREKVDKRERGGLNE